jgi:hypothetical protein
MRLLPIVLLTAACSHELERPSYILSSLGHGSTNTRLVRATTAAAEATSHTTPWSDSGTVGDMTFYSKGRVVTTVSIVTDSVWTARPPDRLSFGLPNGPWNLPPDSLCTLGYTGTTLNVTASRVLGELDRIRQCGARTFATVRRPRLKDSTGKLSVQAARAELDTWPWAGLCSRVKDSTVIGFVIGDDVANEEWGPAPLATRLAQWDTIAGAIRSSCPGAPVALRAIPTVLAARSNWQWLTTGWAQYAGPRRHGTPQQFFATQVASAKQQRLGLVAGLNLLNGGCGPTTRWCLPDVPGTSAPGTGRTDLYQVSAAEFLYYKTVALSDPYVCASVDWSWGPNFDSDFHSKPEIRGVARSLNTIARTRPLTGCGVR